MEKELKIILKEELEVLSKQAYESAKNKGFYPKDVNTAFLLMFIIVEMSEVLQADRKGRHGSIEDYESEIEMGRDMPTAYKNTRWKVRLSLSLPTLPFASSHSWAGSWKETKSSYQKMKTS